MIRRGGKGRRHRRPSTADDVAAITTLFNPLGYRRPVENYYRFAEAWEKHSEIPLWTVEVLLPNQTPSLTKAPGVLLPVTVRDLFFHKESAINYGVEQIPAEFSKIAWLDADFVWNNYEWTRDLSQQLEKFPVIQLWRSLTDIEANGRYGMQRVSYAYRKWKCCPGGAWAGHRELFSHFGGLFDYWPTGGGDSLATAAFSGHEGDSVIHYCRQLMHTEVDERFQRWAKPITRYIRGQIGLVPVDAFHLYHGPRTGRQYGTRHKLLEDVTFPDDITRDHNGFLEWTDRDNAPTAAFRNFFENRREDD